MACGKDIPEQQQHLATTSTTDQVAWFVDWMPCIGIDNLKVTLKNRAVQGSFQSQLVIQVAPIRTDKPDDPVKLDEALLGTGERCSGLESIVQQTGGTFFLRVGVAFALQSGGSGLGQADVALAVSYTQCGQVVGARSLSPDCSTTADAVLPLTGWLASLLVQKVKVVTIVRSLLGGFEWKLAYRTATTSKEEPSAWTAIDQNYKVAGEFNSGEVSLTLDTVMYVQLGLLYHSSSGAGSAQVDTVVAFQRS